MHTTPISILCLSGFDPTGGAGIQADIESIASMGGHAVPVITAFTVQDTHNVLSVQSVNVKLFNQQVNALLNDVSIKAIKIGMVGSIEIIHAIHEILKQHTDLPVIYDPVLAAGGGKNLTQDGMIESIKELILPYVTVLTPNSPEARKLCGKDDLNECGLELMQLGCESVLITGTHEDEEHVDNLWFAQNKHIETFTWPRLPHEYHGSGCTLASAIAALVAQGLDGFNASNEAQDYSWNTLQHAFPISESGQLIPSRFYWQHSDE